MKTVFKRVVGFEDSGWSRTIYSISNRLTDLDKEVSGITFADEGDAIRINIAEGVGPHADPTDGAFILWDLRSSLSGRILRWDSEGVQGQYADYMAILEKPEIAGNAEISIGTAAGTDAPSLMLGGGFLDANNLTTVAWRRLSSTLSRTVDANPSGNLTAILKDPARNVSTGSTITGTNTVIGAVNQDPRHVNGGASPYDIAAGAGNISVQRYFFLNVRVVGSSAASALSYLIKPRALILPWQS